MVLWRFLPSWWRRRADEGEAKLAELPVSTRRFVSLLKVPNQGRAQKNEKPGLVFLLATESLSERSSADSIELVRKVRPSAVIAQVDHGSVSGIRSEELGSHSITVPSSLFGVIRDCFMDVSKRSAYDSNAGLEVLKIIFGTTCHGHVLSAKQAAIASNASFFYLETPKTAGTNPSLNSGLAGTGLNLGLASLNSGLAGTGLNPGLASLNSGIATANTAECPPFASSVYSLLVCLQHYMPEMKQELHQARELLFNVEQGLEIHPEQLAAAQKFRRAKESLRIELNSVSLQGNNSNNKATAIEKLEELPVEDQGHVLMVQAIQEQARRHGSVVVVINASRVGGIRKHWNTKVPPEVVKLSRDCLAYSEEPVTGDESLETGGLDKGLAGSGAVAAVGIASLPWWASFSKVVVLKAPAFAKMALLQFKRNAGVAIAKSVFPGGKLSFTTMVKSATSAGKARAAAHSLVATAERATLSGVRTAFYCLMRKRQGMSYGGRPWLLLGGSVSAGAGIVFWRDKLESAIESVPQAPKLARLGRGLNNLQVAASAVDKSSLRDDMYREILC